MEPMSIAECRRQLSAFQSTLSKFSTASSHAVTSSIRGMSLKQKVVLVSLSIGGVALYFACRYFGRKRKVLSAANKKQLRAAARKARRASSYNWSELQRLGASSSAVETTQQLSPSSGAGLTLVDGTPLTPQQLGLMGMEALETVVGYWEDALTAYNAHRPKNSNMKSLTSPEETEFTRMLENILDGAYQLQDDAEQMFIHQHSILNRKKDRLFEKTGSRSSNAAAAIESPTQPKYQLYRSTTSIASGSTAATMTAGAAGAVSERGGGRAASAAAGVGGGRGDGDGYHHHQSTRSVAAGRSHLISVSTVDQDSFVSAQDTIADLNDFEDFEFTGEIVAAGETELYEQALHHLEKSGIPCRMLRTEFVGVKSDAEYLAKLHCLRLGFKRIMENPDNRTWWEDTGRSIISGLIIKSNKDPKDFVLAYDEMLELLNGPDEINRESMAEELAARDVKITNFYDVAFDYILIDSFEDLETPPSSVVAVMKNRWLSNGFKEGALATAVWSVIAAKRRLLKHANGFKAKFYNISENLLPVLAWGFLGPDEDLNRLMTFFKDQVMTFIRDLYDCDHVRYSSVDTLSEDIMTLARSRVDATIQQAQLDVL